MTNKELVAEVQDSNMKGKTKIEILDLIYTKRVEPLVEVVRKRRARKVRAEAEIPKEY